MPATSLPPEGSLTPSATITSPRDIGGSQRCFCSSVP